MILFFIFSFIFDVDYATFLSFSNLYMVEVYLSAFYDRFKFHKENGENIATFTLYYRIEDQTHKKSMEDSMKRIILLKKEENPEDMWFFENFVFFAKEGKYFIDLKVVTEKDTFTHRFKVYLPKITKKITLSDPVLCYSISKEPIYGINKGDLYILPNPSLVFGKKKPIMGIYYEVYNLVPDSNFYEILIEIKDSVGNKVKKLPSVKRVKKGRAMQDAVAINVQSLKEGTYMLCLKVTDKSTGDTAVGCKKFYIINQPPKNRVVFFQNRKYDTLFYLWASPEEVAEYNGLTPQGKRLFLEKFWQKHDYREFEKRINFANTYYSFGDTPGWKTDRGKTYIKYGPPSEIEKKSFGKEFTSYEHWHYYHNNMHFVFADKTGTGEFKLIFSTENPMLNAPDWRNYVDEEDRIILESLLNE